MESTARARPAKGEMTVDDWRRLCTSGRFVEVPLETFKPGERAFVMTWFGRDGEPDSKHYYVHVPYGAPN